MSADLTIGPKGDVYEAMLEVAVTNQAPRVREPRYVVGP